MLLDMIKIDVPFNITMTGYILIDASIKWGRWWEAGSFHLTKYINLDKMSSYMHAP